MVKLRPLTLFSLLTACAALGSLVSCSGSKPRADTGAAKALAGKSYPMLEHPMEFSPSDHPAEARKLWTQKVRGIMTDLNVSRDGSALIVATVPNPDVEDGGGETGHGLTRYDRRGKRMWRIDVDGTVKAQVLTDDGKLALVSTYDNELFAVDTRGKIAWSAEGGCRPIPLKGKFLCYHDDDAEPNVAFDVYNEKGHKLLFYPITRDVLALKVSDDERNVAIALDGGQVVLFDPDFRSVWQRKLDGELLDLAVSSGSSPRVAALYNGAGGQHIAVLDGEGKVIAQGAPSTHVEQIEIAPGGAGVAVYGNSAKGQYLGFFKIPAQPGPMPEAWQRGDARFADYSSSIIMASDLVMVGYEDAAENARHSHLLAFDFDGNLKWNLPLVTEEGAYLYAHGFAPGSSLLAVGTDDGNLSAFRLKDEKAPAGTSTTR
jgi:outer membrane protein assembly factor BamB